ncbi:uncharacterized protein LOC125779291 [Bactrocera dorsalis]|uniref:Uncharacterized protein LOC125779291 n=1 Tax=Bactrocera dorsalis TaxID=27457 RepID=A0ABM3K4S8_BACDO|nr:uncharacterized protein LOC125779291 [Bactrocera dorsalis]
MHTTKKIKSEVRQIFDLLTESDGVGKNKSLEIPGVDAAMKKSPSTSNTVEYEFSDIESEDSVYEESNLNVTNTSVRKELAEWAVKFNISTVATSSLLGILQKYIRDIPKDARTLKCTPKIPPIEKMGTGEYIHYGIEDSLTDFLLRKSFDFTEIHLNINIDGLPLAKSSNLQAWPILINVNGEPVVMVVGAYCENSKALCPNIFLQRFVDELLYLLEHGLNFNGKHFSIYCRSFICDAPARSYVLGVKGHTGFFCCIKCTQKGESVGHRIIFRSEIYPNRTVADFRSRSNVNHHKILNQIAIEKLPIDIVKSLPYDYMYVVCLGVMKSLLLGWIRHKNRLYSLKPDQINSLNSKILFLSNQVPKEFARHPRTLQEIERFKATELRQFLLYTGIVLLADILDAERYNHFLLLSLGMRILLNETSCIENNECAKIRLSEFVKNISRLYDDSFLTFNFHCLTHLHSDALNYGGLESISAFKFETFLFKLKHKCNSKSHIAAQIYNRLVEESLFSNDNFEVANVKQNQPMKYQFILKNAR